MTPNPDVVAYATAVTVAARRVNGLALAGSYLHGSAVLGGFAPGRSDVDLLLILKQAPRAQVAQALGEALIAVAGCPGSGIEASAVTRAAAKSPLPPWPFVVHVTSTPGEEKVVVGEEHGGDGDLALHYAVVRQCGRVVQGPPPAELIGPVRRDVVLKALRSELAWGLEQGAMAYAVLNGARALRFSVESILCSKLEGGEWAICHGEPSGVIQPAMDQQRTGADATITPAQTAWVSATALRL